MAYEGRRFVTMDRHRLPRSRGPAQQHHKAVSIRYRAIKEPRPFGMIGQVEERRTQFHELRLLFLRQNDVFQMSRGGVQLRPFYEFINFRIQAYDKI